MNLHVPQSSAAIADVAMLMMVGRQIMSPQANKPVMGIVQDSLLGAHLMSLDNVFINRKMACHYISAIRYSDKRLPPPCIQYPQALWSGKQLLALLLPIDFNIGSKSSSPLLDEHTALFVRKGQFICGKMTKASLGASAGGFVDLLFREYGSTKTIRWMSDMQRLTNAWLMNRGFAVGVKDCVLSEEGELRVEERIHKAMNKLDPRKKIIK